jgi:NAD(P)-dependent dehydrogenase (short-subunit alcohol dehydrogenase family)
MTLRSTPDPRAAPVIAVTGAAAGIGAACVRLLTRRGATVFALDRDEAGGAAIAAETGCRFVPLDVGVEGAVHAAFAAIDAAAGRLDGLVNSAGVESRLRLDDITAVAWDRVLDINLKGSLWCMQAAARLMRRGGRGGAVVNIASIAGKRISYSGDMVYTASKAAILGLTRHAAFELAGDRIRVNAVCPGPTLTPMIRRSLTDERIAAVAETVPLGRWVEAEDIAEAVAFLLGPASAMCTGTTLDVDGGMLVSNGGRYVDQMAARVAPAAEVNHP